ncbi:magnesium/cobalt transporter CorA [Saprospiraceae bacterium]|nr:magnesium/cobalt transporter CorA [Saprospiraceae bacterium]
MNQRFSPPGTPTYTGSRTEQDITIRYIEYDNENIREKEYNEENVIYHSNDKDLVQWYDIQGLHNVELIRKIGENFGMHPLVTEDIVDIHQRPTFAEYEAGNFLSLRHISYNIEEVKKNVVSCFFGDGFVLTFHEQENDLFSELRQRIVKRKGRINQKKSDYLAYTVTDFVIDNYFNILDQFNASIEDIEERVNNSAIADKSEIYTVKKNLSVFRKVIAPLREAINNFSRSDSDFIDDKTKLYIRDLHDHTIQVMENIDGHREILSSLQDLYLSEISMKMNKIMQFLTITTAIFVPLSFLTGLYGMNFEYIPELQFKNGYFFLLIAMFTITLVMILYFKKKKWF